MSKSEGAQLDRSVVEKAALLARIGLSEDEVTRFTGQLSVVLEAIARLREVDTAEIPPTASVLPLADVTREDVVTPGLSVEEAFANARTRDGDFFKVQGALESR